MLLAANQPPDGNVVGKKKKSDGTIVYSFKPDGIIKVYRNYVCIYLLTAAQKSRPSLNTTAVVVTLGGQQSQIPITLSYDARAFHSSP